MPANRLTLTVVALYLSATPGAISLPAAELRLHPRYGILGDTHAGAERVNSKGQVVPNLRQFTAVNPRELGAVAQDYGVPFIDPAWVKANICFGWSANEPFTQTLLAGTLLLRKNDRPVLEIKGAIDPCLTAGQTIAAQFPHLSVEAEQFPKTAYGRRGVYGIALDKLTIKPGDTFTALLPEN